MSSPYVYTPHSSYQQTPYVAPYYNNSNQQPSPFIPDATLYPISPYSNPSSLPSSPHVGSSGLPSSNHIAFPITDPGYVAPWDVPPPRSRRPSWYANQQGSGQWLHAPVGHTRTRSFGEHTYPHQPAGMHGYWPPPVSPSMYTPGYMLHPPPFHIHPWLNGEAPRDDFLFDLSSTNFAPIRYLGPGQTMLLTQEELNQPATHPPINRLQITCDAVPQWPVNLEYNPYVGSPGGMGMMPGSPGGAPPITLGDILIAVHKALHERITHTDWARLTTAEETAVSRAYTRRCRSVGSMEMLMRSQGVKKVDFLLNRVRFRGLVRDGESFERMKMVVG